MQFSDSTCLSTMTRSMIHNASTSPVGGILHLLLCHANIIFGYSTIGACFQTLWQILTLDHWQAIMLDLQRVLDPTFTGIYVISWVIIAAFIFRNVFVGIIVDNLSQIAEALET